MSFGNKIANVFLISLVSTIVLVIINPQRTSSESSKQHFWTSKTFNESKYDIVAFGDSRMYRGFSTEAFLGKETTTCFNFGYSSASFSKKMLDFCKSKLSTVLDRKLVFGVTSHSFTENALKDEQFNLESSRTSFDVLLRKYKSGAIQRFDPISPEDIFGLSKRVETFHSDGWVSTTEVEIDSLSGLESYAKVFEDNPVSQKAIDDFMSFVQDMVNEGVDVYAYRPSTMLSMDALEDALSGFNFDSFIGCFENAGGKWVKVNRSGYQTYDGSHLDLESTIRFSEWLGREVLD
jgi:hypothetical protein